MSVVAARDDRGDSHCAHGVNGIEAAVVKGVVRAVQETVGVRPVARVLQRLPAGGDGLDGNVEEKAVDESLAGKQGGILLVGILAKQADAVHRGGNSDDYRRGIRATESAVEAAEVVGSAEWRCAVGVGSEETGADSEYADGGPPVFALGQLGGEQPDVFLIGKEIAWELAQGNAAIDRGGRGAGCGCGGGRDLCLRGS